MYSVPEVSVEGGDEAVLGMFAELPLGPPDNITLLPHSHPLHYSSSQSSPLQHGLQFLGHLGMTLAQQLAELPLELPARHLHRGREVAAGGGGGEARIGRWQGEGLCPS